MRLNGVEWLRTASYAPEWLRVVLNGVESLGIALNGSKWLRMFPNSSEWVQMVRNGTEWTHASRPAIMQYTELADRRIYEDTTSANKLCHAFFICKHWRMRPWSQEYQLPPPFAAPQKHFSVALQVRLPSHHDRIPKEFRSLITAQTASSRDRLTHKGIHKNKHAHIVGVFVSLG